MNKDNTIQIEEKSRLEDGVRQAGKKAVVYWRKEAVWKIKSGYQDIVTEADIEVENNLIALIKREFPNEKILGEESGGEDLGESFWVIDPIDGTTNFSRGRRDWCIGVGHIEGGIFDFSLVYVPLGTEGPELYFAKRGKGAFVDEVWNGRRRMRKLNVSIISSLRDASLVTNQEELWNADKEIIDLANNCRSTNIPGSTLYMLAKVAAGRIDIACSKQKKTWDLISLLLIEEAGGKVTKVDGSGNFDFVSGGKDARNDFLATNGILHEEVLKVLNRLSLCCESFII